MLTSTVTLIVLRLFSIKWLLDGLIMLVYAIFEPSHRGTGVDGLNFVVSIVTVLLAVVVWFVAPLLARLVAGKPDAPVSAPVPPLRELYAFAFVLVGLYFVLTSVGEVLVWFRYSMISPLPPGALDPGRDRFARALITLVAGAICIIFRTTWAGKLSESKPES